MKRITFKYESPDVLPEYGHVSIAYHVRSELAIHYIDNGLGGLMFHEKVVSQPYVVNYDAEKGKGPERWLERWNLENWTVISAYDSQLRVGGAVVAYNTPNVHMLEGRTDLAVLWDLRIQPDYRRQGLGSRLVDEAIQWAKRKKCRTLKIETQSNNVPACKLYVHKGGTLGSYKQDAYDNGSNVAQLIWQIDLN